MALAYRASERYSSAGSLPPSNKEPVPRVVTDSGRPNIARAARTGPRGTFFLSRRYNDMASPQADGPHSFAKRSMSESDASLSRTQLATALRPPSDLTTGSVHYLTRSGCSLSYSRVTDFQGIDVHFSPTHAGTKMSIA